MFKKISLSVLALLLAFSTGVLADNEGNVDKSNSDESKLPIVHQNFIPDSMKPGSVIEFLDSENYQIIQGGVSSESEVQFVNEVENDNTLTEQYPSPVKGMKVYYSDDGFIHDITYQNGENIQHIKEVTSEIIPAPTSLSAGNIQPYATNIGGIPCSMYTTVATWGSFPNKLYNCTEFVGLLADKNVDKLSLEPLASVYRNYRVGEGRATTFSDVIGQQNIVLKKGDAATKLAYDNVSVGTNLRVTATSKSGSSLTKVLIKNDAGGMPNAVLDVWKTGVEYWGYTWTSTFSMPGKVSYNYRF